MQEHVFPLVLAGLITVIGSAVAIYIIIFGDDQDGGYIACVFCRRKTRGRATICDVCYDKHMDEFEEEKADE